MIADVKVALGPDGLVPAAGKKCFPHDKHTARDCSPGVHAAHGRFCGILRACGPKSVGFRAFARFLLAGFSTRLR